MSSCTTGSELKKKKKNKMRGIKILLSTDQTILHQYMSHYSTYICPLLNIISVIQSYCCKLYLVWMLLSGPKLLECASYAYCRCNYYMYIVITVLTKQSSYWIFRCTHVIMCSMSIDLAVLVYNYNWISRLFICTDFRLFQCKIVQMENILYVYNIIIDMRCLLPQATGAL